MGVWVQQLIFAIFSEKRSCLITVEGLGLWIPVHRDRALRTLQGLGLGFRVDCGRSVGPSLDNNTKACIALVYCSTACCSVGVFVMVMRDSSNNALNPRISARVSYISSPLSQYSPNMYPIISS